MHILFLFHHCSKFLEVVEHFTSLFHKIDPHLSCVVINKANIIVATSNRFCLGSPHITVYYLQGSLTYFYIMWKCMPCLFTILTRLTSLVHIVHLKLWQPFNNIMDLHFLQPLDVDMSYVLTSTINISNRLFSMCKHCNTHC